MGPYASQWLASAAPGWALVLARVAGLSWTAPALATPGLGARLRLLLAALLTALLVPVVGPPAASCPAAVAGGAELARALAAEVLVGAALGWSAALIVAGARQAGELVGAQAGLSAAALFDPEAGDDLTPLGHLYGLVALAAFLALDGPLVLVRALVDSYRILPAGGVGLSPTTAAAAFARVGRALELSLRAAAPIALATATAGVALGLLGRAAPSLPLAALALPVRTAIGLGLAAAGLAVLAATASAAWGAWPGGW